MIPWHALQVNMRMQLNYEKMHDGAPNAHLNRFDAKLMQFSTFNRTTTSLGQAASPRQSFFKVLNGLNALLDLATCVTMGFIYGVLYPYDCTTTRAV